MGRMIRPARFASSGSSDPYSANVVFYLAKQSNGSTTIADAYSTGATCTRTGTGSWTTSQAPSGATVSYQNAGTSTDRANFLTVSAATAQNLAGDFTIDGWFYVTSNNDTYNKIFAKLASGSGGTTSFSGVAWERSSSDLAIFNANSTSIVDGAHPRLETGAWHHLAIDRSSNTLRMYLDGNPSRNTITYSSNLNGDFNIGAAQGTAGAADAGDLIGYIGPVRITKGVARWAGSRFVPTIAADGWSMTDTIDSGYSAGSSHRYWRVVYTGNQGNVNSAATEVQFRGSAGGSNLASGGTPLAVATYPGEGISNAFDGSTANPASPLGKYGTFGYDFGSAVTINEVAITSRSSFNDTMPNGIVVQSSNDGKRWFDEWTVSSIASWSATQTRVYTRP